MGQLNDYLEWSEDYSVGDTTIDEQHKRLFGAINQLAALANQKDDDKTRRFSDILKLLLFLNNYIYLHFQDEERAMAEIKYEGLKYHKFLHQNFSKSVSQTYIEFLENEEIDLDQLLQILKDWLSSHILQEDMRAFNIVL